MPSTRTHPTLQPSADRARTAICTLGMHRSGTSLVARMVNLMGVHLGKPESLGHTGEDNPRGYWEHQPLSRVNDEILVRFGGRWDDPPSLPSSWTLDVRLTDLRARARHLLTEEFAAEPLWGWKDPRTCLTLPFWQDLVGDARYILCLRNPCAVVASLARRNGMPTDKAERLWLAHVESSLVHTTGRARMFVFYEDVLSDWQGELARLSAFIGRPDLAHDRAVHASIGEFLDDGLCHHRMSLEDLAADHRISYPTKSLYVALRGAAPRDLTGEIASPQERTGRLVHKALDLLAFEATAASRRMAALAAERDRLGVERHEHVATIGVLSAERSALSREVESLREQTAWLSADNDERSMRETGLRDSLAGLESDLRRAALHADSLMLEQQAQSATIATLTAEREVLAATAAALGDTARSLSQEYSDLANRETELAVSVASLESELRSEALARQTALRAIDEIHGSFAWTLVTVARRVIEALLPAGTRRRAVFHQMIRRIAGRLPSSDVPHRAADRRTG